MSILELARRLSKVERTVRSLGSTPQLAHSSLEDGAVRAYSGDSQVMTIGRQWDGTYVATSQNGPVPPTPSAPIVTDGTESLVVRWDGTFAGGAIAPMDFLRVDIHIGITAGFTASHANRRGSILAPAGGEVTVGLASGTYFVKLVCWSYAGVVSPVSAEVEADAFPVTASSDGFAPASSPAPYATSGLDSFTVRWQPITNFDPVTYDIHVSTTIGFTADSTNKVGESRGGSQFTVRRLAGAEPAEGEIDPFALEYGTTYYARVVARDVDGSAPQSAQAVGMIFQVTGVNIAADTVAAAHIQAGTLTGELFSAEVVLASVFRAGGGEAGTGQRIELAPFGIRGYKSNGDLMINFPTEVGQEALFDGELVVRGATILGGMSIQSLQNEMTADSALTLQTGITSPTASPQFQVVWDTLRPDTTSLTDAQKTDNDPTFGLGGPFDLSPANVTFIQFRPAESGGGTWILFESKAEGTRKWYFDVNGDPKERFGVTDNYFDDVKGWRIWSAMEIPNVAGNENRYGTWTLFQFIGGSGDWYIDTPPSTGRDFQRVSPLNASGTPVIGTNGVDMYLAETVPQPGAQHKVVIRYYGNLSASYTPGVDPIPFLPAPTATYQSTTGYAASLCSAEYNGTAFDITATGPATHRYATAERGVAYSSRLVYHSGSGVFPGVHDAGVGGWAGTGREQESWESPTTNRRGMAWDANNACFWTYGGDGYLYRHTSERWDPGYPTLNGNSTAWGAITFRSATLGYETLPGTKKSFTRKRRAKFRYLSPSIPYTGDAADPSQTRLYMATGLTEPATTALKLQGEVDWNDVPLSVDITTIATGTAAPPTTNTFPGGNAALIRNQDDSLAIDATGLIRGVTVYEGADRVAIRGPYAHAHINADTGNLTSASWTALTTWTLDSADGITHSSGNFTVPKTGRYRVTFGASFTANATGSRGTRVLFNAVVRKNNVVPTNTGAGIQGSCEVTDEWSLTAGQAIRLEAFQNSGSGLAVRGDANSNYTTVRISWAGP